MKCFFILFSVGLCDYVLLFRAEFSAVKFLRRRDLHKILFLFSVHSPHSRKKIDLTRRA